MRKRIFPPAWVLLLALVTALPVMAEAEKPAPADTDSVTEQGAADTSTAVAERPGAVVKVVKHEGEAPSMRSLVVVRDAESGAFRAPTDEEWADLASTVAPLNRSFAGLTETYYEDGTVGVDLQGRYQSMMTARQHDHGPEAACTHDASTAVGFLVAPPTAQESVDSEQEASDVR